MNWDYNSDQPYVEMDPKKKKKARLKQFDEMLKILAISLFVYPIGYLYGRLQQKFFPKSKISTKKFFGLAVNLDKYPEESIKIINELKVESITIRIPLWEIKKIKEYRDFASKFQVSRIVFILMQNRETVEDITLLKKSVTTAFSELSPISEFFQFGVAINRYKWGYFTTKEYLQNCEAVGEVVKDFPKLKLLGSSVIDFEYLLTIRNLFNLYKFKFFGLSSLLYVDRRGAPENYQAKLNLKGKIDFLWFINLLSFKTTHRKIFITETNWPIKDSQPYTPTSNKECVTEDIQADYLVRYYLLALASGKVESVFWHQLFSPGFGLIDFRDGLRKRESFYAFKFLNFSLKDSLLIETTNKNGVYKLEFVKNSKKITIYWGEKSTFARSDKYNYYKITGEEYTERAIEISSSPIYEIEV